MISSGAASSFYRNYQIVATPFLFPNYRVAWGYLDGDWHADFMSGLIEEAGLRYLGRRRGPLLVQLSPLFEFDHARLAYFLTEAPAWWRLAVEFRHPSWYEDATFSLLSDHDAALCAADTGPIASNDTIRSASRTSDNAMRVR